MIFRVSRLRQDSYGCHHVSSKLWLVANLNLSWYIMMQPPPIYSYLPNHCSLTIGNYINLQVSHEPTILQWSRSQEARVLGTSNKITQPYWSGNILVGSRQGCSVHAFALDDIMFFFYLVAHCYGAKRRITRKPSAITSAWSCSLSLYAQRRTDTKRYRIVYIYIGSWNQVPYSKRYRKKLCVYIYI